eukprot:CAMPEP_0177711330 /NCGR_PEP_ID=MMETSP0484_2-20121128/11803_1 /TAXON_ID=354590 /ORGANISM="Rhodomonas lens, Strain RHODO" /LENGTH=245 /DNA_ID=CAMNT_0019223055 /DNA_START=65 /DNA_END=802 /DNA_ORIENTATION=+
MMLLAMLLGCATVAQAFVATPVAMHRMSASAMSLHATAPVSRMTLRANTPVAAQRLMATKQQLAQQRGGRSLQVAGGLEMRNFVVEGAMRVVACLPYILPMMDSLAYGRFLFQKVPILAVIFMKPLQPFVELSQAFPMLSFAAFLGLFLFVVRNKAVPRFIRFNTMQALLLEIMMIFPQILTSSNMGGVIPFMFTEFISNMTFYAIATIVGYSCFSNLIGELPCKIPVVSTAVFQQIGGGAGYDN